MNVSRETAEKYFNDGLYEDAVFILEIILFEEIREWGHYSARTLETRTRVAEMYIVQEKYVEALTVLLDVFRRKLKRLPLRHPSVADTRNRIINLLLQHGSLDLMSQVIQDIEQTFRFLMKITRKKYQKGLHEQALIEGIIILDDMVEFFGNENRITLDMDCLVAVIYTATEEYSMPLQVIKDVCEKQRALGLTDRSLASTVMAKASIYLKMGNFEEAMSCYCEAYSILQLVFGFHHRKTLVCLRHMAEFTYIVGNYGRALLLLKDIADIQKLQKHKELTLTKLHIGILEYARGNYEDALSIFRDISIDNNTPKRMKAMILNTKGATLVKLGQYNEARILLKDACHTMKLTNLRAETLSTYRNYAVLLAQEGNVVAAETMLLILVANAALILNPLHSVVFSIENDLADVWFSRRRFNEALSAFMKLWTLQRDSLGEYHPATLRAKCQVAKVYKEQGKYDEALRIYNEVLPVLKAHFHSQHLDCLDVQSRIASIYLCRSSFANAFEIYYNIYTILKENYDDDHRFVVEIIGKMQHLAHLVPTRRVIEAALNENINYLVTLIDNQEDINVRDVNGAVALHHLSRKGNVPILTYLLNKGAIYDLKDMSGNTPESMSANLDTKLVFLLVKRLFECIETAELDKIRRILRRERLIINARDMNGRTPLMKAVAKGNFEIVNELLSEGADVSLGSEEDGNVLHVAAEKGQFLILELLVWYMRAIYGESFRIFLDSTDNELGATPLHCAARKTRHECAEMLRRYSANPHIADAVGKRAYEVGRPEMQKYLWEYSLEFNAAYQQYHMRELLITG